MEFTVIKRKLEEALQELLQRDRYLLEHDINERTIAHRLAIYLEGRFEGFNVDCECNGNVDAENGRKYVHVLKAKARQLHLPGIHAGDDDLERRSVYPDVIVHRRGLNGSANNLLIVELKKSSNPDQGNWDAEKLVRFTSGEYENSFNYACGAFARLIVGDNPSVSAEWYQDGKRVA